MDSSASPHQLRPRAGSLGHNGHATERSKQLHSARLLCRSTELLLASRAFAAWAAATRERKLKGHMNRCSTMVKHNTRRHDYSRFFLRWLAFTESRVSLSYRSEIQLRKDVPLRSKADFLALARRYFAKWRMHLRETKQRTIGNVHLLLALNRERLRSRVLLKWWRFAHAQAMARHEAELREHEDTCRQLREEVRRAVHEAEGLRNQLASALQDQARLQEDLDAYRDDFDGTQRRRQQEVGELRDTMRMAMQMVEGSGGPSARSLRKWGASPSPNRKGDPLTEVAPTSSVSGTPLRSSSATPDVQSPLATSTTVESPANSAQHSKETRAALVHCLEGAVATLSDLSHPAVLPASLAEAVESLRRRLDADAAQLASITAQRDELVAAVKTARLAFASTTANTSGGASFSSPSPNAHHSNNANSLVDCDLDVSRGASVASARRSSSRVERVTAAASFQSGGRRSGAAAAIIHNSLPAIYLPSGTSTPAVSLPTSPADATLTDTQELPRLLLTDTKHMVNTVVALRKSARQAATEVTDLQDAALRAISALGGSGVDNAELTATGEETAEARVQRSGVIAVGLRNLCEDMIVVLVLTSLWSGQRASERVSEALERLWHRTQDLESTHAGYLQQLEGLERVVHTATRLLRQPPPTPSTASTPRGALSPRKATGAGAGAALARRRHSALPPPQEEGPPTADEMDAARRSAEELAAKGDARPAELLRLCETAQQASATQSTVVTSEWEALLQSAHDLLGAAVGVEKEDGVSAAATTTANDTPSAPDTVLALKGAVRRIARVVAKVSDNADAPLLATTQRLLEQLEQAKKAVADGERQLRAAEAQVAAAETQRSRDAAKHETAEQKLRQQLEALAEQQKHNELNKRQLEGQLREGESQARLAERSHKKELDEAFKERRAVEKDLQQQIKTLERELDRQTQEKQRSEKALQERSKDAEKALQRAQEGLEKEKAAHAHTQQALDAQLKAAMSDSESSSVTLAKLQAELKTLRAECQQAEEGRKRLAEDLQHEKDAHEQVLKDSEEQRETVASERQLHAEETEQLTATIEELKNTLQSVEEQQTSSGAKEQDLQQQLKQLIAESEASHTAQKKLQEEVDRMRTDSRHLEEEVQELKEDLQHKESERTRTQLELDAQKKAFDQEKREQGREKQRCEKALHSAQENLEKEKAAHAHTQQALDAQLKVAMSDSESSSVTLAKLQAELKTLRAECQQAEEGKKRLAEDLQHEKDAHEQVLKDSEEQRETVASERQLHAEETEQLTATIEELKNTLQSVEEQQTSSGAKEQDLQQQLDDLTKQNAASTAAQRTLEQQLRAIEDENRVNNAVGVFLRDVLRDCLTRLHLLTCSVGDAEPVSPRASLTLQQASNTPPPLLTHDSDPSDYVEYILRLDGNDPTGKRLVQEHLRENSAVHGLRVTVAAEEEEERHGRASAAPHTPFSDVADPSTWEVVAELHDRLVLLYDRLALLDQTAADHLTHCGTLSQERDQLCADALTSLQQLQAWSSTAAATAASAAPAPRPSRTQSPQTPVTSPHKTKEASSSSAATPVGTLRPAVAGPALRTASSEVAEALAALQRVADSVRPLVELRSPTATSRRGSTTTGGGGGTRGDGGGVASDAAVTAERHLQALIADVEDMASCLQHLSESVQHGIIALGGGTTEDEDNAAGGGPLLDADAASGAPHRADCTLPGLSSTGGGGSGAGRKLDSRSLAARLETICVETGTSILEVRRLLLGGDAKKAAAGGGDDASSLAAPAKPPKLGDVIPQIRAKMAELEEVKRESARLLHGLNRAFDDDEESLFAASVSSTQSRSLKPKKKPLPAFQGTPEAGLRLLQQEMKGKKGRRAGPPQDGATLLSSFGSSIRERLGDLQHLRLVCRNTLLVLEGRSTAEEDGQLPTYGGALVTLLTTQVEDLKQALVESDAALKDYRRDLRNVAIGTRLHLLADVVNSLKLERDALKEDINRRGRQSNMLLDDLNKEVKALKAELQAHRHANAQLSTVQQDMSGEVEAQKRNAGELAGRLAQLQHESNVLSSALARCLQGLPASAAHDEATTAVERSVQAALKRDQGDALVGAVEEAVRAAAEHQRQLHDTVRSGLGQLRTELHGLRDHVTQSWTRYGKPMSDAAALLVTETAEVLTLENDMLRPRAIEREQLRRDVARLTAALAESTETRTAAMERLATLDDENTRLRRALRDAEMAATLKGSGEDDEAAAALAASRPNAQMAEWERRHDCWRGRPSDGRDGLDEWAVHDGGVWRGGRGGAAGPQGRATCGGGGGAGVCGGAWHGWSSAVGGGGGVARGARLAGCLGRWSAVASAGALPTALSVALDEADVEKAA